MEESTVVNEWIAEAHGRTLLRLAAMRFGPAPGDVESALLAIKNPKRLEHMMGCLVDATVTGWADLVAIDVLPGNEDERRSHSRTGKAATDPPYIGDKYFARGLEVGLTREAKWVILLLGTKRLGPPPGGMHGYLSIIDRRDRLENMIERILDVTSWEELIAPKDLFAEIYGL